MGIWKIWKIILNFTVARDESDSKKRTLEGRSFKHTLTLKAYSWLEDCFLKPKKVGLTAPTLVPVLRPGIGVSTGEIPVGETAITGRCRMLNNIQGEERLPSGLGVDLSKFRKPGQEGVAGHREHRSRAKNEAAKGEVR